jgi:hypothetical protein
MHKSVNFSSTFQTKTEKKKKEKDCEWKTCQWMQSGGVNLSYFDVCD